MAEYANRPYREAVWVKTIGWFQTFSPTWNNNYDYVLKGKHEELQKAYIDNPDLEFEVRLSDGRWIHATYLIFSEDTEYRIKPSEQKIERRWKWLKDYKNGATAESEHYMSDEYIGDSHYVKDGWYKNEDDYIDIRIEEN